MTEIDAQARKPAVAAADRAAAQLVLAFDADCRVSLRDPVCGIYGYRCHGTTRARMMAAPPDVRGAVLIAAIAMLVDHGWLRRIGVTPPKDRRTRGQPWYELVHDLSAKTCELSDAHLLVLARALKVSLALDQKAFRYDTPVSCLLNVQLFKLLRDCAAQRRTPRLVTELGGIFDLMSTSVAFTYYSQSIARLAGDFRQLASVPKKVVAPLVSALADALRKHVWEPGAGSYGETRVRRYGDVEIIERHYDVSMVSARVGSFDFGPHLLDESIYARPSPGELDDLVEDVAVLPPSPLAAALVSFVGNLVDTADPAVGASTVARLQAAADRMAEWKLDRVVATQTRVRRALAAYDAARPGAAAELLAHLSKSSGSKPSAKWLETLRRLVPEKQRGRLADIVTALVDDGHLDRRFHDPRQDVHKGLLWAAVLCEPSRVGPGLERFARVACYYTIPHVGIALETMGNACLWALIDLPDGAGVPYLARLQSRVKYPKVKRRIDAALDEASAKAGISRGELDELSIPTHGLDADGRAELPVGDGAALLSIQATRSVAVRWRTAGGRVAKSIPAALKPHKEALKAVRSRVKEIEADLAVQPQRLQRLWLEDRRWPAPVWQQRYLRHPCVAALSRRLIWNTHRRMTCTPVAWSGDALRDVDGRPIDVEGTEISLWHPIGRPVEEVLQWRSRLGALGIVQPFKQAHREVYLVTDAERRTGIYSNRFAGHIVRQHQLVALARVNGWMITHRIWADRPNDEPTHIVLPQHGLVAEYWTEGAGGDEAEFAESGAYLYLTTDQLRFYRLAGAGAARVTTARGPRRGDPVRIEDVPPLVLSEVMRHCDLFVSVASVANDPGWADGGRDALHPDQWRQTVGARYWHEQAFGELGVMATTRRSLLLALLPSLAIGKVCRIDGRFLRVEGKRRAYRIHLGSGNVVVEPADQYLCIVPKLGRGGASDLRLPFEGDAMLSIILSKAALLAADAEITDPTILGQLDRM